MNESRPIRVMTVDDHDILRGGIRFSLLAFDDLELVAEARSGQEALRLCDELQPDVVIMDMLMPEMNGVDTTRAIKSRYPQVQILVLSSFHDRDLVQSAVQAGAIGYLVKGVSADELAEAIRDACAGRTALGPEAAQALSQRNDTRPPADESWWTSKA